MASVKDILQTDNRLVQKHGLQMMAIADYDTPFLENLIEESTKLPVALPTGWFQMGYIVTGGVSQENDISMNETMMEQDLEPVREDLESIKRTLKVSFGESSAWTNGLYHGLPCSEWAAKKTDAWDYDFGDASEPPFYRLLFMSQEGTGSQTKYRVEHAYRARVTNLGERAMNRADAESFEFTFGLYKDPAANKVYRRAVGGPFYGQTTESDPKTD